MKTHLFATFCLGLTTVYVYFYGEAKAFFHRPELYKYEIDGLKHQVQKERFEHLLTKYEFEDFRAHVATVLPEAIDERGKGEKGFPMRSLASVVQKSSGDGIGALRAKSVFEKGKRAFRDKKFETAISNFQDLLAKHAYSAYVPEAMFLTVESYFRLQEYDSVVENVNRMLEVYPEDELTGYALLRLGAVYERKSRHDDAIEIYQTVLKVFPQRNLASLARSSLRATEL